MNAQEAKQILTLYRPGTADAEDPSFAEALRLCENNAELKRWFAEHCAVYKAMRTKFKQISVPEGLKEQILAERKVSTEKFLHRPFKLNPALLARTAIGAAVLAMIFLVVWLPLRGPHSFHAFHKEMVYRGMLPYGMDLETNDLSRIRAYLAGKKAVADFTLPEGLQKNATTAGCVAMNWQGRTVSMICFQTGRPLPSGAEADLWLFVIDREAVFHAPDSAQPRITTNDEAATATWTANGKTYLLAVRGDEQLLRKFL